VSIGNSSVRFATAEEAAQILSRPDAFANHLSAFDRAIRTGERGTSKDAYLVYAGAQGLGWPAAEEAAWRGVLARLADGLEGLVLPLPPEILLVRTTGKEEFGAAHTRGPAIILPTRRTGDPPTQLLALAAHELFHIASRYASPQWHDSAYALLGFERHSSIAYPPALESLRITNPDAFSMDHVIEIETHEKSMVSVAPILSSKLRLSEAVNAGGPMGIVRLGLLAPETGEVLDANKTDYHRRVGRNTSYVIHPEEAVADQFSLLLMRRTGALAKVPAEPGLLDALEKMLSSP